MKEVNSLDSMNDTISVKFFAVYTSKALWHDRFWNHIKDF